VIHLRNDQAVFITDHSSELFPDWLKLNAARTPWHVILNKYVFVRIENNRVVIFTYDHRNWSRVIIWYRLAFVVYLTGARIELVNKVFNLLQFYFASISLKGSHPEAVFWIYNLYRWPLSHFHKIGHSLLRRVFLARDVKYNVTLHFLCSTEKHILLGSIIFFRKIKNCWSPLFKNEFHVPWSEFHQVRRIMNIDELYERIFVCNTIV
jgi:hypothetical protein